jgi:hypothetical protein
MTLTQAAESWARARGFRIPQRGTPAWGAMFQAWQRSGMASNPLASSRTSATRPRRANRSKAGSRFGMTEGFEEFSTGEAQLGAAGVSRTALPVLDILARGFGGGRGFSRDELANEAAGQILGAKGQPLSPGSASARTGLAISELERRGYVVKLGRGLNRMGRPGPMTYALTKVGEERALAQRSVEAQASGDQLADQEIARYEARGARPSLRPLSGPVYRPSLPVLETPGHKLPALQKTRMKKAGYRVNPRRFPTKAELIRLLAQDRVQRYPELYRGHESEAEVYWRRHGGTLSDLLSAARVLLPPDRLPPNTPPYAPNPRAKLCQQGRHDFEPVTGLCRRQGCDAFHHAGQGALFGRDLDPVAVREAKAREAATGQSEMFGRIPNPLSVLVLNPVTGASPRAAVNPPRAARQLPGLLRAANGRALNPPPGTIGVSQARSKVQEFHGAPVARWVKVVVDDGRPGITRKAYAGLGVVPASVYAVPFAKKSNKHGEVWEHDHGKNAPLEAYDPLGHVTVKFLSDETRVADWWREKGER